jgi:hypothetical protein
MIKLPKRYKNDVGKFIGGNLYVHRDYEDSIPEIKGIKKRLEEQHFEWKYDVVKWNVYIQRVSFIQCPGFDTEDEPVVGDSLIPLYGANRDFIRTIRAPVDPWIYHHKFLFVHQGYKGFSVEKSMERSLAWMSLDGIDYSRIGKKSYWEKEVAWRLK